MRKGGKQTHQKARKPRTRIQAEPARREVWGARLYSLENGWRLRIPRCEQPVNEFAPKLFTDSGGEKVVGNKDF